MKTTIFTTSILSFMMLITTSLGHAVVVNQTEKTQAVSLLDSAPKTSPIEKAIQQNKTEKKKTHDGFRAMNAFKSSPSQNFFAMQNYRFTIFMQNVFF